MAKSYELTEKPDVPAHHTSSVYADIIADFLRQGTDLHEGDDRGDEASNAASRAAEGA